MRSLYHVCVVTVACLFLSQSGFAQSKFSSIILVDGFGTARLTPAATGLVLDRPLILDRPGSISSRVMFEVPPGIADNTTVSITLPSTPGALLTAGGSNTFTATQIFPASPAQGDEFIDAINLGSVTLSSAILPSSVVLEADLTVDSTLGKSGTGTVVLGMKDLALTEQAYTNANVTVDRYGRVRAAANGSVTFVKSTITASNGGSNDLASGTAQYYRISGPTANFGYKAISGGVDGRVIVLLNTTSFNMSLTNLDAAATLGARIVTNSASATTTSGAGAFTLIYDSAADGGNGAWILLSTSV